MTILLLGSGGREHALAYKLLQSPKCQHLFVAPGNAGTAVIATNVSMSPTDFESIKTFVIKEGIDMVVVGPEDPLVHGIYDFFKNDSVTIYLGKNSLTGTVPSSLDAFSMLDLLSVGNLISEVPNVFCDNTGMCLSRY